MAYAEATPPAPLSRTELERYSRQLLLPEFADRQPAIRAGRVLVVGAGGLGTPVVQYLAGAGVGRLGIADDDVVGLSNLQRQTLYATPDVGRPKAQVAAARAQQVNPFVQVEVLPAVGEANAAERISRFDVVVDATDNFTARYLISDACAQAGRPCVWGAAGGSEGMLSVFAGGRTLRQLFPEPTGAEDCDTIGVLGPLLGVVGSMMALEVLKLLSGAGDPMTGRLWVFDALSGRVRTIRTTSLNPV